MLALVGDQLSPGQTCVQMAVEQLYFLGEMVTRMILSQLPHFLVSIAILAGLALDSYCRESGNVTFYPGSERNPGRQTLSWHYLYRM